MSAIKQISSEFKQTFALAIPLITALLAQIFMEFVDTVMMGRLGPLSLAAGGLGSAIFITVFVLCLGFMIAVGTFIARSYGEKNGSKISHITRQGLWLSLFITIPCMAILWFFPKMLTLLGQQQEVVRLTQGYLHGLLWSLLPAMGFTCLREFVAGLQRPRIIMYIAIPAIFLNAGLNYILMYGKLGLPELGVTGIGWATTIVALIMFTCLIIFVMVNSFFKNYQIFKQFEAPSWQILKEIIQLGWPIGVMLIFEVGLFSVTAVLMGIIGTNTLAAYQVALQCVSVVFMIPLGISQATTLRVSHALGEKNPQRVKNITNCSLLIGILFAIFNACIFISFDRHIIGLYLNINAAKNAQVVDLALSFLRLSTIFLLMDAVQIISNGALRGLKDTLIPMYLGLISYWGIGIGFGLFLGFYLNLGGNGLWWGLIVGITSSGLLLLGRLYFKIHQVITLKFPVKTRTTKNFQV